VLKAKIRRCKPQLCKFGQARPVHVSIIDRTRNTTSGRQFWHCLNSAGLRFLFILCSLFEDIWECDAHVTTEVERNVDSTWYAQCLTRRANQLRSSVFPLIRLQQKHEVGGGVTPSFLIHPRLRRRKTRHPDPLGGGMGPPHIPSISTQ